MSREAKLTLRLVDAVSGPGRAAAAALRSVQSAMSAISTGAALPARALADQARGIQRATAALAPAGAAFGLGLAKGARDVYAIEKALNVSVAAGGLDMEQRNEFMEEAIRLNAEFAATSGEIIDAGNRLLRAGLGYEQMMGSLPGVLSTAQAMDVPMEDASKAIVNSMVSMQMAMKDTQETMRSSTRVADLYAHAVNSTTGELEDFSLSSRYFNPVAAAMGMSPEEAMALQIALAKNGIMGSSAGTGLRSAPVSIADPSPKAREAFAGLGIDPAAFTGHRTGDASGASIAAALEAAGFTAEGIEEAIDAVIQDPAMRAAPGRTAIAIMSAVGDEIGVATAEDRALVSDAIQRAITAGVREVDLVGALRALRDGGAGITDFTRIFGRNHASKMLALDPKIYDEVIADIQANAAGTSKRMREAMMSGIVGDVAEADAAFEKLFVGIGRAGVLADASRAIANLAKAVDDLADANPRLLKFATYSAAAVAVLPALGFGLMGAAAALSLLVSPLALATAGIGALVALNWSSLVGGMKAFGQGLKNNLSPATVKALRDARDGVRGWLGSFGRGGIELRRVGLELGRLAAGGITAIVHAAPGLRNVGAAFRPLATAARDFLASKWSALREAGAIVAEFAARVGPAFTPAFASAVALVGGSLDTLGRGAGAVGRLMGGATEGALAFVRGIVGGIDTEALASVGRGLSNLFETLGAALPDLASAFDRVDLSFAKFAEEAGASVGRGLSRIIAALASGREGVASAWESVKAVFTSIGSYMPSFGGIVGAVSSFVDSIVGAAERLAGAVTKMLDWVRRMPGGGGTGAPPLSAWSGEGVPVGGGDGLGPRDGGGRATGGLARAGYQYEVNERGQELITIGGRNAWITPAHRLEGARGADVRTASWRPAASAMQPVDLGHLARDASDRSSGSAEARTINFYNTFNSSGGDDVRKFSRDLENALRRSSQIGLDR